MSGSSPEAWLVDRSNQGLALFDRIVLAQRVTLKPCVHEYALQVRMPPKADPEHVPDLALEPVGSGPQRGERIHLGAGLFHGNHQPQSMLLGHGVEVVDDREARRVRRSRPGVLIGNLRRGLTATPEEEKKAGAGRFPKVE